MEVVDCETLSTFWPRVVVANLNDECCSLAADSTAPYLDQS